ncbi:MAG: type II secretion system protein GspE [Spartobacteria bacterium]|nr:type II secretion system protein GspE [Spartobacteria bacterium]
MLLGELLVEDGKATGSQIAHALEKQRGAASGMRLGEILREDGVVSEEDVLQALARQFNIPFVAAVDAGMLDAGLVRKLPVEWARAHGMLPVRVDDRCCVLTSDPSRIAEQDDLALLMEIDLTPLLAPRTVVERSIEQCYFQREESSRAFIEDMEQGRDAQEKEGATATVEDLLRNPDAAPVTQLVNLILLEALKARASDVHIEPFDDCLRVRFRIDGMLYEQTSPPKRMEAALISRLKVMGHLDIAERRLPQDGMAKVRVGEREVDIRISTIPVAAGERVVLRLLNLENVIRPLTELGMPGPVLDGFRDILKEAYGAIWVTGPTGSGKTTTLYAALQELDTRRRNILTIEDPVEYQLDNIGQISVKPKIGLTFSQGLRHILRQDPDVILVGETRDLETVEIAIRASLTGHLVFSTLHTNDALGAITRLVDMGVAPYLVAAATRACMAQRLVRTLCPRCKKPAPLTAQQQRMLGSRAGRLQGKTLYTPGACDACIQGYQGRVGIYELLRVTEPVRDLIREGRNMVAMRAEARRNGMQMLVEDGINKVLEGVTSVDEMLRVVGRDYEDI